MPTDKEIKQALYKKDIRLGWRGFIVCWALAGVQDMALSPHLGENVTTNIGTVLFSAGVIWLCVRPIRESLIAAFWWLERKLT